MSGDHNMHCSGNQCQGHAEQQERDQNPALIKQILDQQDEIESLRAEVVKWGDRYYALWVATANKEENTRMFSDWADELYELYREEE